MAYDVVAVLPAQGELLESRAPSVGFVAGLGAGKSAGTSMKAVQLAVANQGLPVRGFFASLTRSHVRNVLVPELAAYVSKIGVHFEWKASLGLGVAHLGDGVRGEMLLVSGDRPEAVVGLNAPWAIVDEAGLQRDEFLQKARPRVRFAGSRQMQYVEAGTPEGIGGEFHEFCEGGKIEDLHLIRANTRDNIYLPPDYVEKRFAHFSDAERDAYERGLFVAKSGRVYTFYDPARHERPCSNPFDGELVIGADFGSRTMPWAIGVVRENEDGDEELHLWGEVLGRGTTTWEQLDKMKALILDRYEREFGERCPWDHIARQITVYCDSNSQHSGYGRDGTSRTDMEILVGAGFEVQAPPKNPNWKDRVASVQELLRFGRFLIDEEACPYFAKCFRSQGFDPRGRPLKSKDNVSGSPGLDHGEEAAGYICFALWPVQADRSGNSYSRL